MLLSDLCLEGHICDASRLFVVGMSARNLIYSKKYEFSMYFLSLITAWHSLLPQLLDCPTLFMPNKYDNSPLVLQGLCAAGRVPMDGKSWGILTSVKVMQIGLR